jgi:hypothetical protein
MGIKEASESLRKFLSPNEYDDRFIIGIDEKNGIIYIYTTVRPQFGLKKKLHELTDIAQRNSKWEGFQVQVKYTGQIRPCIDGHGDGDFDE